MKEINKNIYQEAKYGRKQLIAFAIVVLILSLAVLGGGIALVVFGSMSTEVGQIVWKVIVGALMILLGLAFSGLSITMLSTGISMLKINEGNVKDGNRAKGTVNIVKCDKCGEELPDNATFCSKCGTPVDGMIKCECGAINKIDAQYCTSCGKKLK